VPTTDEHPEVANLNGTAARHITKVATAQRGLATRRSELTQLGGALEKALDAITPPHSRYRIRRWQELTVLLLLTIAEVVVAETVVQALGLSASATDLVAVVVGAAATGMAWLIGHEWAIGQDPQALAAGRRGWLSVAGATGAAFLIANLGVRVYYGLLDEQANHLGSSLMAPLLTGSLLTAVTAVLMVVAAFVTAHAETAKEAELQNRLRQVRSELHLLDSRIRAVDPDSYPDGHLSIVED
jgi:hypothetical protein